MSTVVENLELAKERIKNPKNLLRSTWRDPKKEMFCAAGSLIGGQDVHGAFSAHLCVNYEAEIEALWEALPSSNKQIRKLREERNTLFKLSDITTFNDTNDHGAVLALFDRAIEAVNSRADDESIH